MAVLTLGGCSALGASEESLAPDQGVAGPVEAEDASGGVTDREVADQSVDRSIIVTGSAVVTVDDPLDAAREAVRIVERIGGRVDSRQEYAPTEFSGGSATLVLRIPADQLTPTLDELRGLGRADSVALWSADVTVERQDLDARINALRTSIERLNALLERADEIADLIALEAEVSSRQGQLESLEAQQRYLADQVSMSTLTLELRSERTAPDPDPDTFLEGLAAGWGAFVAFWTGALVVLGVVAPWLVFLGLLALGIVVLVTALRRRSASSAE